MLVRDAGSDPCSQTGCNIREALDQVVRVADLASLVLGMLLCAIYVASVWRSGPRYAAVLILRVDLLRGRILLARYLRLYMSDTAGILQSRLGPIGPEVVETYNVGRHIDWGMCGFGWGAVFRRRCCCGKGVDMVVAEDMGVEERTSLILIGNQETARLLEQASTSPSPRTSNSTSTSTRHQVGIRHAVKVGTRAGTALLYKQSHAVMGG